MWVVRSRFVLLLVLVVASSCSCIQNSTASRKKLKVLGLFQHPGYSHCIIFKTVLVELARRGHDVTVMSYFPRTEKEIAEEPLPNYKDIDLREGKYDLFIHSVDLNSISLTSYKRILSNMYLIYKMASATCSQCLGNQFVRQFFDSNPQFDVTITEAFNTNCANALLHKVKAPLVLMSSHLVTPWTNDDFGVPQEASYMPSILTASQLPLGFFDRVSNLMIVLLQNLLVRTIFSWRDSQLVEKYGLGPVDLHEVNRNASLLLTNSHYVIHGAAIHPHNVVEVGGLHVPKVVKPLPKDIAKFLDEAHEGVLYFNLGSLMKTATAPKEKLELFVKVFNSLPRKVLWKWDVDIENLSSNIMLKKWLPQYDVLNHPNVKCFFGHGGLLGITESVKSGVPMILLPLFGDQFTNAKAVERRGFAMLLDFTQLTEENIRHAIDELFNNTKYTENAKALSRAFVDRPMHPLDEAVWWVEYVARGNGPYLANEGAKLTWYQYHYVDVWAFLLVVALLFLYSSYTLIKCVLFLTRKTKGEKATKSKKQD
ncbi:unnamed protein product [Xylocopa violacea]|uniref:UDP-glucuronosyltransferase n=1 Tax=Xylocopa violacea TaxID=135666 RepID=A0ABP1N2W1_XYLVO